MSLTSEDVRDILHLVDDLQVDRLHLRMGRFELFLRRGEDGEWTQSTRVSAEPVLVDAPVVQEEKKETAPTPEGLAEVRTPLPGTFYRAPKPGAPPFVEVGDKVEEHTVGGIVETMKMMTPVHAGVRGTVVEFRTGNGEFAEADAVLLVVEPR